MVVVETSEEPVVSLQKVQLNWIQLGVFTLTSSYEGLAAECKRQGMDPLLIQQNEKTILVVGCSTQEELTQQVLSQVEEMEIEYIVKEAVLTDEAAITLAKQEQYQTLLEGYVYQ